MAEIVFGIGCSHSPLLATKPEDWDLRAQDDRKNPAHPFRGKVYSFQELEQLRRAVRDQELDRGCGRARRHASAIRAGRLRAVLSLNRRHRQRHGVRAVAGGVREC
jgi:hypothetical protein